MLLLLLLLLLDTAAGVGCRFADLRIRSCTAAGSLYIPASSSFATPQCGTLTRLMAYISGHFFLTAVTPFYFFSRRECRVK